MGYDSRDNYEINDSAAKSGCILLFMSGLFVSWCIVNIISYIFQ